MAKIAPFTKDEEAISKQLDVILESQTFKGSRRSQDFLKFVVEKSLSGQFGDLKERILGIEIFGRSVTYDTSQDAIVRVTARDVRKRLGQYYEKFGSDGEFRIDLQPGSYIPEFSRITAPAVTFVTPAEESSLLTVTTPAVRSIKPGRHWVHVPAYVLAVLGIAISTWLWFRNPSTPASDRTPPWSAIFRDGRQPQLIFCDASIQLLQGFLNFNISLSDYATHKFIPSYLQLSPEVKRAASLLVGPNFTVTTAPVDLRIASRISGLPACRSRQLRLRSARELDFRDFKTDNDFIILGSPRSNPWTALFQDQLDFTFDRVPGTPYELCRNAHPKPGERSVYVPTAIGGATGDAYAIAAFIQNSDQSGNVIILAGSNAEGTEAAAAFMTDADLVDKTLRANSINPTGAPLHFEALLRLTTMAGSPNRFQVIALHRL
ncbi:MAG TPA: hypothetical protein VK638_57980 [Edaphobacter sp.]|nr:hypothetical protein [Edaphobacter sp.]